MAVYAYTATAEGGSRRGRRRGTITADSPRQARDRLRAQGLSICDVVEQQPGRSPSWAERYLTARQRSKVTALLQEMATLLAAGVPLLETLGTITRQHHGRFRRSILLLRDHVAAGGSLAEAMGLQPTLFDPVCRSIVEVGENAGTLDAALGRLVGFRRRSAGLRNRVASALLYPCIVLLAGLGVSLFLMTYVVPNLLTVLLESGRKLPAATMVVKAVSDVLVGWWWAILLSAGGLVAAVAAVLRTDRGLARWHRIQLGIPLLGELIRKQAIARVAVVMATLLKSGVVFVRAVRIARRTVRNRVLRDALVACETAVYAGRDIAVALEQTRAFPPLVIQVFAVGQASGRLDEMLEDLATDYDTLVDITLGRLTTLLEPILMILLAIVVGLIAFAAILPILEAGNVL
jgi:type II secretory pathway component PulF